MVGKTAKRATVRAPRSPDVAVARPREPAALVIAKRIEEDIVLGRRQPRERLVELDLCELFQTHRGDVRLALFELEKKGLVERIPNRGALVRGLTPREVQEIYAVREQLEVMAVSIIPLPACCWRYRAAGGSAAPAHRSHRRGRFPDRLLQQPQFSPDVVRSVRQCLSDRDHRFAGAEGLRHPVICECISGRADARPAGSSRHDQGAAWVTPRRACGADPPPFAAGPRILHPAITSDVSAKPIPIDGIDTAPHSALLTSLIRGALASMRLR